MILVSTSLVAQDLNAWVYFKDKANTSTYLQNPGSMLTQRALERKQRHNISIDDRDVPVNQEYVAGIQRQPGISYRTQSKWFNCAHVTGTFENLQQLESLDYVQQVVYSDPSKNATTSSFNKFQEDILLPANYGNTRNQIEMIGLDELHNQGHTGSGIIIAVTDSGFPNVDTNRAFATIRTESRILGGYDFVAGNDSYFGDHFHGARVLSIMAGQVSNGDDQYVGTAPDASYYLFRTEDDASETPVEMSYWVAAAERADSLGVDVVNVSLGYLGFDNPSESLNYEDMNGSSFISRGATVATEKGMLIVTSAGNSGNSTFHPWIAAPADAPGVFAIGAVTPSSSKSSFSSIGPTRDGRIRPSVAAQGSATQLVEESGELKSGSGTSYSGPIIAGAMACLIQAYPQLSVAELIEAVQQTGTQSVSPDNQLGYGIPNFGNAFRTLSQQEITTVSDFKYYVKDKVLYIFSAPGESEYPFQLFNLQGQLILETQMEQEDTVDLSQFSSGLYLFRSHGQSVAHKISL
ncbi:subtilisin-like serine proteases [Nonlabens marinus S1-08]|uniref:Subtilisin-like serine proteases n=2 Tax=Nonlabens TaxID=363408 RepID=W8VMT9_9FLAO|nr:subtilisin-like serine proteases [Nonlabens marinus S1-08]